MRLYRRLGLKPTAESKLIYEKYDELYAKSRQLLPEEIRPKNMADFQKFLNPDPLLSSEALKVWKEVMQNPGRRWNSVTVHNDENGNPMAVTFYGLGENHETTMTRLLNPARAASGSSPFLLWRDDAYNANLSFDIPSPPVFGLTPP